MSLPSVQSSEDHQSELLERPKS
jgi:hypothetical protein